MGRGAQDGVPVRWLTRWRIRRQCFHHDHTAGESWISSQLIDGGMRKHFWCTRCDHSWFN